MQRKLISLPWKDLINRGKNHSFVVKDWIYGQEAKSPGGAWRFLRKKSTYRGDLFCADGEYDGNPSRSRMYHARRACKSLIKAFAVMEFALKGLGVRLIYLPSVVSEIDRVIDLNLTVSVNLVSLFISRLLKGLQNLSNSDALYSFNWGQYSYEIEDIGIVCFRPVMDATTGEKAFVVESIQWAFATSTLFSEFTD